MKRTSHQAGLSTPSTTKRPSSALDTLSSVPSTPSASLTSLRADLQASASASALQHQINSSKRENASLLRELGAIQERVKNLEKERAILLAQQDRSLIRDNELETRQEEERRELAATAELYRERCSMLEEEKEHLTSTANRANHKAEMAAQEAESIRKQMDILKEELQKIDDENKRVRDHREELNTARETIHELQTQLSRRPSSASAETRPADVPVLEVLRKELHHQVTHLRTMEHTNSRLTREVTALRSERANAELLKEEKLSLETKLRRMERLRKKLAEVEGDNVALKREKDEWAAFLQSSGSPEKERFSSPAHLTKTLASTRIELLSLQDKLGNTVAQLKTRNEMIEEFEGRVKELEEETLPHLSEENQRLKAKLKAMDRTQALDSKEVNMLREQLVRVFHVHLKNLNKPAVDKFHFLKEHLCNRRILSFGESRQRSRSL